MSIIVALSGGKASAWCAGWAFRNYQKDDIILYFNDTKWEHEDLYRFLNDLSQHFDHPITFDNDGRNPEELFYDHHALANNRMPFCSHELKAERLQRFYRDSDTLVFGIGASESHRAVRIASVYDGVSKKTGKRVTLRFPLVSEKVTKKQIDDFLADAGIREPLLYSLGFSHNNCSGGCVRAGKKQWKMLYDRLPNVYADRERVEKEFREFSGKNVSFFKDETLTEFRKRIERGDLSGHYASDTTEGQLSMFDEAEFECIGICSTLA